MYWHAEIRGAFEAPAAVRVLIYNAYSTPPPTPITTDPFTLLRPTNLAGGALPRPRTLSLSFSSFFFLLSLSLRRRSLSRSRSNRNAGYDRCDRLEKHEWKHWCCLHFYSFRVNAKNVCGGNRSMDLSSLLI